MKKKMKIATETALSRWLPLGDATMDQSEQLLYRKVGFFGDEKERNMKVIYTVVLLQNVT